MIVPKLYGRLGNQCFQIAAAIAHSRKMKTTWAIPRVTNDMRYWPNYFARVVPFANLTMSTTRRYLHNEKENQEYGPLPDHDDLTLNGYFQCEKYFDQYDDKYAIGDALGFHHKGNDGYVAIHVRRGDYVSHFSDKWPPLTADYYTEAIKHFHEKLCFDNFRVYSDDIEWCKKYFTMYCGLNFSYSNIKDPLTDMRDMYNASGFIIANSTFSLFPALLRLDNPIVISPAESRWYGPGNAHITTKDLMPERFIKM